MSNLIERKNTADAMERWLYDGEDNRTVREVIYELPSAQPEIVRCKECIMHDVCRFEQGLGVDGYCSQAERRTDESD